MPGPDQEATNTQAHQTNPGFVVLIGLDLWRIFSGSGTGIDLVRLGIYLAPVLFFWPALG